MEILQYYRMAPDAVTAMLWLSSRLLAFRKNTSIDIQFFEIAIDAKQIAGIFRFAGTQFLIDTFGGLFVFEELCIVLQLLVDDGCEYNIIMNLWGRKWIEWIYFRNRRKTWVMRMNWWLMLRRSCAIIGYAHTRTHTILNEYALWNVKHTIECVNR